MSGAGRLVSAHSCTCPPLVTDHLMDTGIRVSATTAEVRRQVVFLMRAKALRRRLAAVASAMEAGVRKAVALQQGHPRLEVLLRLREAVLPVPRLSRIFGCQSSHAGVYTACACAATLQRVRLSCCCARSCCRRRTEAISPPMYCTP